MTDYIINGFQNGFELGYRGNTEIRMTSPNLKLRIGDEIDLWNKIKKEVKLSRFAGSYKDPPFIYFIQSPLGLVPKDKGNDMRLIFHLSYPRCSNRKKTKAGKNAKSVNGNIPDELSKTTYPDFTEAIQMCLDEGKFCHIGRSDFCSAFRNLRIRKLDWYLLLMRAKSPLDGSWYYFVDKCLPFGSSISCYHFQNVSDAIAHLVMFRTNKKLINYLDDFLFATLLKALCDQQIGVFTDICNSICFPIATEKTFWRCTQLTFLGFLIDMIQQLVLIPCDKVAKGTNMISHILNKKNSKITILQLQKLCGFLNFLRRAILPGRAFMRRLYSHLRSDLKSYHHIKVTKEMKLDLTVWLEFLRHPSIYCRSFMDYSKEWSSVEIDFYTDSSKNPNLGFGGKCKKEWMVGK